MRHHVSRGIDLTAVEMPAEAEAVYADAIVATSDHAKAIMAVYLSCAVMGHKALAMTGRL